MSAIQRKARLFLFRFRGVRRLTQPAVGRVLEHALMLHRKWAVRAELLENRRQLEVICALSVTRYKL
jgi:hypothetical protein